MNKTKWLKLSNWKEVSQFIKPKTEGALCIDPESYGTNCYHCADGPLFDDVERVLIHEINHVVDIIGMDGTVNNAPEAERLISCVFTQKELEKMISLPESGRMYEDAILNFPGKEKMDSLFNEKTFWDLPAKNEVNKYAPPVCRYEADRNDMRVVLLLDPARKRYMINYGPPEHHGISSMVLDFFENKFNMFEFYKIAQRDGIFFFEKSGHSSSSNDVQKFKIFFNYEQYCFTPPSRSVRISGKRQRKFLKAFLGFMNEYVASDIFGYSTIRKDEIIKIEDTMEYYKGTRAYSMPLFDLVISYDIRIVKNEDYELPVACVNMYYIPFARRTPRTKWRYHDIVYEGSK